MVESFTQFMGDELFLIQDIVNYDVIPHEGGNKYKYLNLFDFPEDKCIQEQFKNDFIELHKIISKSGHTMDLEGMCLVNLYQVKGIRLQNLLNVFSPKYISFWGADPQKLGLKILPMKGIIWNGIKILRLDSLDKTFGDTAVKAQTEQFLKYLFGIK
ncbi:MAG: hypothetical protein J5I91_06500 [Bacteroidetes bacterium]|nr:hypothetical protein [Bacteroidota bacterium]